MFYDEFVRLCNEADKSPTAAAKEMGFSGAHVTRWKNGSTPTDATKLTICNFFGLPQNYFDAKEKVPTQKGEHLESNSAFFRLKKGLEPYNISEADADFLLDVYKAHIKKNQQE